MGFFSFKDSKTNKSIPAYPYAKFPLEESWVIMVLPDNNRIEGIYDGYGNIGNVDIFKEMEKVMKVGMGESLTEREGFVDSKKITSPDGKVSFQLEMGVVSWNKIIDPFGKTLKELKDLGYTIESNFDVYDNMGLFKIVKKKNYNGENYNELESSKRCEFQGYFYDAKDRKKVIG